MSTHSAASSRVSSSKCKPASTSLHTHRAHRASVNMLDSFMQGDAYWALAMAINVYLTFYHKFDARALRRMEIPYFLCCYGIPFIPGFTFLFVSNDAGRPYGNAVLWCWLRPEWGVYRIATFYGPVWYENAFPPILIPRAQTDYDPQGCHLHRHGYLHPCRAGNLQKEKKDAQL